MFSASLVYVICRDTFGGAHCAICAWQSKVAHKQKSGWEFFAQHVTCWKCAAVWPVVQYSKHGKKVKKLRFFQTCQLEPLRILRNHRISPAGQNIDKDLFILRLPSRQRRVVPVPRGVWGHPRGGQKRFEWVTTLLMSQYGIQFMNTYIFMTNTTFEQRFCLRYEL